MGDLTEQDHRYLDAKFGAIKDRFDAMDRAVLVAQNAAKEAGDKAERAYDKRLEGMNEFRDAMKDQNSTFMPREQAEAQLKALLAQVHKNEGRIDKIEAGRGGFYVAWTGAIGLVSVIALVYGVMT